MENGLAKTMVYGNGSDQNTKHHYGGTLKKVNVKKKIKKCSKKGKK